MEIKNEALSAVWFSTGQGYVAYRILEEIIIMIAVVEPWLSRKDMMLINNKLLLFSTRITR